jgi:septum formation protein
MGRFILASASPRRLELLRSLGVEFEVIPSKAEELHDELADARKLCELNAERKALEVAERFPDAVVFGADTLVTLDAKLYGKPADLLGAKTMLRELSGRTHEVITGLCLMHRASGKSSIFHDATRVTFKELTESVIEYYVANVQVLDKAGAYGIQERGEMLVEKIEGSYSNVVGLPVERLSQELRRWRIPISITADVNDRSDAPPT